MPGEVGWETCMEVILLDGWRGGGSAKGDIEDWRASDSADKSGTTGGVDLEGCVGGAGGRLGLLGGETGLGLRRPASSYTC